MFRIIMVPLDGSPFSEEALPFACMLARQSKAQLHLAHVHIPQEPIYSEPSLYIPPGMDDALLRARQKYLKELSERLVKQHALQVQTHILQGHVSGTIQQYVTDKRVDLVVLTSHGRGALSRAWFGSVADDLIRHLTVPVLVIRPPEIKPEIEEEPKVQRMLIALDGSPFSEQILPVAGEVAGLLGSRCTLLRVIPPMIPGVAEMPEVNAGGSGSGVLQQLRDFQEKQQSEAYRYLQPHALALHKRSLHVQNTVRGHEQPATAILDEARKEKIDLIALAGHGRGGVARVLLGSTADKVIRGADCPVLVFKHGT